MRILLTGATGYIGRRLLPALMEKGHEVFCCVRDKTRFRMQGGLPEGVHVLEVDFLRLPWDVPLPENLDAAFYLIHSMNSSVDRFDELEFKAAVNFRDWVGSGNINQVIYLGGLGRSGESSRHLVSRRRVGEALREGKYHTTILRAGIIMGSGSASFEIIRDLVEKLPVMVAPRWVNTRCQPIAVRDVIAYLGGVLGRPECYGKVFDIGGPEVMTYRQMLKGFAKVRGLTRKIITVPVLTPRLSSYWLYFITSTSYRLSVNLVNSMRYEVVCSEDSIREWLPIPLTPYIEAVRLAYDRIEQDLVASSWSDSFGQGSLPAKLTPFIQVPGFGCYKERVRIRLSAPDGDVLHTLWSLGGRNGWYHANWLWELRGLMDKMVGGVGMGRKRTHSEEPRPGDALDFWRVLLADREQKRLLLYAEMKLPGEAWLDFRLEEEGGERYLVQTATFRPRGVLGRLYWLGTKPFHGYIFAGMAAKIAAGAGAKAREKVE